METEKPEIFKLLVITTIDDLTKEIDLIKRQEVADIQSPPMTVLWQCCSTLYLWKTRVYQELTVQRVKVASETLDSSKPCRLNFSSSLE